jgi:hypothetical protein
MSELWVVRNFAVKGRPAPGREAVEIR